MDRRQFIDAGLKSGAAAVLCHAAAQCAPAWAAQTDRKEMMCKKLPMQEDGITRLSRIEVYPEYLEKYKKFATEVGEVSLRTEPGVLTMYAMAEKDNPHIITILETYASQTAYRDHIASEHFQKYKQGTLKMVKSLQLIDQKPLNPANRLVNFMSEAPGEGESRK